MYAKMDENCPFCSWSEDKVNSMNKLTIHTNDPENCRNHALQPLTSILITSFATYRILLCNLCHIKL
jgi:hypothetical protein